MPPPSHLLAPVRDLCAELPGVEEIAEGSVGDPVWKVRGKIFVMQHQVDGEPSLWFKAAPGVQETLIASDANRWFRPPYVGGRGWVGVWLNDATIWPEVEVLIEDSWRLTASKTQVRDYDALDR